VADYIIKEKKISYVRPVKDVNILTGNTYTVTNAAWNGRQAEPGIASVKKLKLISINA